MPHATLVPHGVHPHDSLLSLFVGAYTRVHEAQVRMADMRLAVLRQACRAHARYII